MPKKQINKAWIKEIILIIIRMLAKENLGAIPECFSQSCFDSFLKSSLNLMLQLYWGPLKIWFSLEKILVSNQLIIWKL